MPCCSCLAILAELVEEEENYCVAILGRDLTSLTRTCRDFDHLDGCYHCLIINLDLVGNGGLIFMMPIFFSDHCDGCDHIISFAGDIILTSLATEST